MLGAGIAGRIGFLRDIIGPLFDRHALAVLELGEAVRAGADGVFDLVDDVIIRVLLADLLRHDCAPGLIGGNIIIKLLVVLCKGDGQHIAVHFHAGNIGCDEFLKAGVELHGTLQGGLNVRDLDRITVVEDHVLADPQLQGPHVVGKLKVADARADVVVGVAGQRVFIHTGGEGVLPDAGLLQRIQAAGLGGNAQIQVAAVLGAFGGLRSLGVFLCGRSLCRSSGGFFGLRFRGSGGVGLRFLRSTCAHAEQHDRGQKHRDEFLPGFHSFSPFL